jgi:outer membrane protein TolC
MAAANAQLGIAQAAFFPTVLLSAAVGLESSNIANLFSWPSLFWSIGSALAHTAFDGGRRQAVSEEVQAAYDATVATYRQTVLTAFQSVEDNLAALRILEEEAAQQEKVVQAAETALLLAINRYKGGVTNYLEVIIVQSAALTARRNAVDLTTRRMVAAVLLIKALGGSWQTPPTAAKPIPRGVTPPSLAKLSCSWGTREGLGQPGKLVRYPAKLVGYLAVCCRALEPSGIEVAKHEPRALRGQTAGNGLS